GGRARQGEGVPRAACRRRCKPAAIRTLAYAASECRVDAGGSYVARQALRVRRGDREPITVAEFGPSEPVPDATARGFCGAWGEGRNYFPSVLGFPVQRVGVSPDGSRVVFEVNQKYSVFPPPPSMQLSPEQEGIFLVRSDGSQPPRRLGPPSRDPSFRVDNTVIENLG